MVSSLFIFFAGTVTSLLCLLFLAYSARELRRLGRQAERRGLDRR